MASSVCLDCPLWGNWTVLLPFDLAGSGSVWLPSVLLDLWLSEWLGLAAFMAVGMVRSVWSYGCGNGSLHLERTTPGFEVEEVINGECWECWGRICNVCASGFLEGELRATLEPSAHSPSSAGGVVGKLKISHIQVLRFDFNSVIEKYIQPLRIQVLPYEASC